MPGMRIFINRAMRLAAGVWAALLPFSAIRAQVPPELRLGTNLHEVVDYSPQLPFLDIFLYSREWFTQCRAGIDPGCANGNAFDTGEAGLIALDPNGWVERIPARADSEIFTSVATVWDVPPEFPGGRYIVLYEGSGTLEYDLGMSKDGAASAPGRDVISVNPAGGPLLLRITATNPANYIRNIRVVRAQDEAKLSTERFTDAFLNRLAPFQALRFMDWMRTNNSTVSTWSGRARTTHARFSTAQGVPPEIMVELANRTAKTPWFNMPAAADDTFIRNFAALVRDSLSPELPVFVEYSNEVWNPTFSQGAWVEEQALKEFSGQSGSPFTKRLNWYGKRSAEICDLWREAFAAEASRVVCVLGSQAANPFTADEALRCPLWSGNPCAGHGISDLAIAPYLGDYLGQEENLSAVRGWLSATDGGRTRLFRELAEGGEIPAGPSGGGLNQSLGWIEDNRTVAESHGLTLIAYEGGQHLVGIGAAQSDAGVTELFTSANRDARMGTLYTRYLQGWQSRAGSLFMHFSDIGIYSRFGSWGALETIGQTTSPKFAALTAYAGGVAPTPGPAPTATPTGPSARLTVEVRGGGRVRMKNRRIDCGTQCSASFPRDKLITLRALPAPRHQLSRWQSGCRHTRSVCSFRLRRDRTIRVRFKKR